MCPDGFEYYFVDEESVEHVSLTTIVFIRRNQYPGVSLANGKGKKFLSARVKGPGPEADCSLTANGEIQEFLELHLRCLIRRNVMCLINCS
jgi:hypothetical protein